MQRGLFKVLSSDRRDHSSAVELTLNAAKASNKGVEVELAGKLTPNLTAHAAFGVLDSKFDEFPEAVLAGGNVANLTGLRLPKTPKFTFSGALDYDGQFTDSLSLFGRAEVNHRSSAPGDLEGVAAAQLSLPRFPYLPEGYTVVNLRLGVRTGNIEIGGFVENLFKEDYYTGTQDNFGLSGIRLRPHPRVFGVTAKASFGGSSR